MRTRFVLMVALCAVLLAGCAAARRPEPNRPPDPPMGNGSIQGPAGLPGIGQVPGHDICTQVLSGNAQPKVYGIVIGNVAYLNESADPQVALVQANCPHVVEIRVANDRETALRIQTYATEIYSGRSISPHAQAIAQLPPQTSPVAKPAE